MILKNIYQKTKHSPTIEIQPRSYSMRIITKKINIYKFHEANDELKEKIKENFHLDGFLYEHNIKDRIETLKKLAEILDGNLDYSLSCVPDRGEFIKITPKNEKLNFKALWKVIVVEKAV
jgi:hypothetical protein